MNPIVWGALALAGTVALVTPTMLRPLLHRLGVLDVPSHRSSHTEPTLRGGGIAPLLGFAIGGILAIAALPADSASTFAVILTSAVLMGLVGMADDLRGLHVAPRAALQILIGGAVAIAFWSKIGSDWMWIPFAAVAFAANVNFTNFMDGVNGISSLHGLVAGMAFAALGALEGEPWLATAGLLIAFTFISFLPWNLTTPGMFLGDVGSYLLGGALGATSIAALTLGLNPLAALAPLSIYWADAVKTLLNRALRRESVFQAHRSHTYQRLTNTGLSHTAVAGIVTLFTLGASAIGLLAAASAISSWLAIATMLALAASYLLLPSFRGDVSPQTRQNELISPHHQNR